MLKCVWFGCDGESNPLSPPKESRAGAESAADAGGGEVHSGAFALNDYIPLGADGFIPVITMRGRGFAANVGGTAWRVCASPLEWGRFFYRRIGDKGGLRGPPHCIASTGREISTFMEKMLREMRERVMKNIEAAGATGALEQIRVAALGKKGELTALLRGMGKLPPEERPKMGQMVNEVRAALEQQLEAREKLLAEKEKAARLAEETIDVTLPGPERSAGSLHPMNIALRKMVDVFVGMGYEVVEGPEVEFDHYNFELLNIPKNHPARDAQDTFYIDDNIVLRTHTSPVQARIMTTRKPPIRVICPGRVYRADEADATHSPVFHQMEGLVIDENITMGDLKGTLDEFARQMFGEGIQTRFRPSFFPFTEPSAEVDLTCANCKGAGCRMCKGTGWIEVLGAGMVNPHVLEMCGIDPQKYSGFAFGMGVERMTLLKYNIPNLRYLYENDLRFLTQYR